MDERLKRAAWAVHVQSVTYLAWRATGGASQQPRQDLRLIPRRPPLGGLDPRKPNGGSKSRTGWPCRRGRIHRSP